MTSAAPDTTPGPVQQGLIDSARPERAGDSSALKAGALRWFERILPGRSLEIAAFDVPKGNGFSADIFLVTLKVDGKPQRYVMRRDAQESALFPGLDMSHQAVVMKALHGAGRVPVPAIIGEESDPSFLAAPFFVMEHIDGRVPADSPPFCVSGWVVDLPPKGREELWWAGIDALAGIAALDWVGTGLGHLVRGGSQQTGLQWEFEYYLKVARDYCGGVQANFIGDAADWIARNMPPEHDLSLCWGDARIGNMIFRGTQCAAVIDWELSTIGAIERDIGWWFYIDDYWHEGVGIKRATGWPSHAETLSHFAGLIEAPLPDVAFYHAFAAFRSSVTSARATFLGLQPPVPVEDYPPARVFKKIIGQF